jgi:hypothetical protein
MYHVDREILIPEKLNRTPHVFHLDQKRLENNSDGTVIESTREWAATLTFPDSTSPHL